jgi:outer membrane lipoprotein-sorting protein
MKHYLLTLFIFTLCIDIKAQTPETIIEQHLAALGGPAALDSLETVILEADIVMKAMPDLKNTVHMTIVHRQAYRMEMKTPQVNSTVFMDGNKGWNIARLMGQRKKLQIDSIEACELRYQTDLTSPLHRYREKGYAVSYLGKDTVATGAPAHIFKVEFAPQTSYWCYLDAQTLLEVHRRVEAPVNRKLHTMELTFSDYRLVDGRTKKPYRIVMKNKRGEMTYNYSNIILNPPVDRAKWAMEE